MPNTLGPTQLICPPEASWQVILASPLVPLEVDLAADPTPTIVFLPAQLGKRALAALQDDFTSIYEAALATAFGFSDRHELLEPGSEPRVVRLDGGGSTWAPNAISLTEAIEALAVQLLDHRFPEHPEFAAPLTPAAVEHLRSLLEQMLETRDGTLEVEREDRRVLGALGVPLGLCRVYQLRAEGRREELARIEYARDLHGVADPTVAQARAWLDPNRRRGLPPIAADLLIWLWSRLVARHVMVDGVEHGWTEDGLPDEAVLVQHDLPTPEELQRARTIAAEVFGVQQEELEGLAEALRALRTTDRVRHAASLPEVLAPWMLGFGDGSSSARYETAEATAQLIRCLSIPYDAQLVRAMAAQRLGDLEVVSAGVNAAVACFSALASTAWSSMAVVRDLRDAPQTSTVAMPLLRELATALSTDELHMPLAPRLEVLEERARDIMLLGVGQEPPAPSGSADHVVFETTERVPASAGLALLDALRVALQHPLGQASEGARLELQIRIVEPPSD